MRNFVSCLLNLWVFKICHAGSIAITEMEKHYKIKHFLFFPSRQPICWDTIKQDATSLNMFLLTAYLVNKHISWWSSRKGIFKRANKNYISKICEKIFLIGPIHCNWLSLRGEGDDRGWDGWMASQTLWMWVWVNSGSWWWTGRPGVLWSMGSHRVRHDWVTELN